MMLFEKRYNLERMKVNKDIKGLLDILRRNPEYDLEQEVYRALKEIGEYAVTFLISFLKMKTNDPVRHDALALGEIGDKRAVAPLIDALEEGDYILQRAAAAALGEIRDSKAVKPLIQILKNEHIMQKQHSLLSISMTVVGALGKIGDATAVEPLMQVLENNIDFKLGRVAAMALGEIGDKRAEKSLKLAIRKGDRSLKEDAREALAKISK